MQAASFVPRRSTRICRCHVLGLFLSPQNGYYCPEHRAPKRGLLEETVVSTTRQNGKKKRVRYMLEIILRFFMLISLQGCGRFFLFAKIPICWVMQGSRVYWARFMVPQTRGSLTWWWWWGGGGGGGGGGVVSRLVMQTSHVKSQ